MAVFMLNVCKFNSCGLTFKSLGHLIQHIEETHIDYDPHVVEQTELQQPTCIPLSYALRFLTDAARKEGLKPISQGRSSQTASFTATSRNRNNAATPTGSEAEEGDEFASEPEDSNDSWTTSEEFSADFILRYGSRIITPGLTNPSNNNNNSNSTNNNSSNSNSSDKPFACPVPGCKKRYKNVNGIKYHSKNGHKNDGKVRKAFRCPCGKSYKTPYGLKNHAAIQHAGSMLQIKLLQNGKSSPPSAKSEQQHQQSCNVQPEIQSQQQQRDNISKNVTGNTAISLKVGKQSLGKAKIAAIEDHGYIKSDRSIFTDPETVTAVEHDDEDLGILTPASTPPLPSQSPGKIDIPLSDQRQHQQHQQERSLQKYLANVIASSHSGIHRRNVIDNINSY